jgi:hypothetical protein
MAPQPIRFDPEGGSLTAVPSVGHGAAGSYSLTLFESNGLTVVKPSPFKARFGGSNKHGLPGSAEGHDGRVLVLLASVGLMDATRAFAVHLSVVQDGQTAGTVSDVGQDTGTGPTHESKIIAVLTGEAPPPAMMAAPRKPAARRAAKRATSETSQLRALRQDTLLQLSDATPTSGAVKRVARKKRAKRATRRGGDK